MNAYVWSVRLSWVLDFLAMGAIAGTGEVRLEVFVLVAALFFLGRIIHKSGKFRIPEKLVMTTMVLIMVAAAGAWFRFRFHPIIAASYAAPIVHSMLWFAPETGRYRGWRLGVGFVQLILAAALAPDFYLFPAIFAFVLLGAVAVSCGFLDEELRKRAPEERMEALPAGFIRRSLSLAFLIFLSSMLIFPILPRMNGAGKGGYESTKVGYTENVELSEKKGLNGSEGTGEVILRLYSQTGMDLTKEIYLGLIRGRSLDFFDGLHWSASPQRSQISGVRYVKPSEFRDAVVVDVVRAAMPTSALPVPYGAIQVLSGSGVEDAPYPRTRGGEWVDTTSVGAGTRYSFAFFPYQKTIRRSSGDEDPPVPGDVRVPDALKNERMERLAKTVFRNAKTEAEKVERLMAYLTRERFSASLGEGVEVPSVERMHPIERFLFVTKEGHCEWFASASTMLLRLAGVPSRLVAGFRIAKGPLGGVLTLTTNDAHAWVEYWSPSKGWIALDPTPRLIRPPSLINFVRDGYEWVSAYWYRYVLNFTEGQKKSSEATEGTAASPQPSKSKFKEARDQLLAFVDTHRGEVLIALVTMFAASAAVYLFLRWRYPWIFSISYRVREGDVSLRRERMRMERLLATKLAARSVEDAALVLVSVRQWQETYHRLRFGLSHSADAVDMNELRRRYQLVKWDLVGRSV